MDSTDTNGEDTTSSSSEEEKEADAGTEVQVNGHEPHRDCTTTTHTSQVNGIKPQFDEDEQEEEDEEEDDALPTIYFSHTVEPKKVSHYNICCFFLSFNPFLDRIHCIPTALVSLNNFLCSFSVV